MTTKSGKEPFPLDKDPLFSSTPPPSEMMSRIRFYLSKKEIIDLQRHPYKLSEMYFRAKQAAHEDYLKHREEILAVEKTEKASRLKTQSPFNSLF